MVVLANAFSLAPPYLIKRAIDALGSPTVVRGEVIVFASLIVLTGIALFDDLAAVLEMSPEALAAIWNDLPLDDLRIASMLQVTRQQVINLRKSARQRLERRMSR